MWACVRHFSDLKLDRKGPGGSLPCLPWEHGGRVLPSLTGGERACGGLPHRLSSRAAGPSKVELVTESPRREERVTAGRQR